MGIKEPRIGIVRRERREEKCERRDASPDEQAREGAEGGRETRLYKRTCHSDLARRRLKALRCPGGGLKGMRSRVSSPNAISPPFETQHDKISSALGEVKLGKGKS